MKRLTHKDKLGYYVTNADAEIYCMNSGLYSAIQGALINKLAQYENDEENKLLIKIPCKIGSKIYTCGIYEIYVLYVSQITIYENSRIIIKAVNNDTCTYEEFTPFDFGRTVFLTEKEAKEYLNNRG